MASDADASIIVHELRTYTAAAAAVNFVSMFYDVRDVRTYSYSYRVQLHRCRIPGA